MLSAKQGRKINIYVPDYVVYDLETTGTDPHTDEVIEIAGIKVQGGKVVEEFSTLVNPGIPIPDGASSVNEIYDDMVADSPDFEAALKDFMDFAGEAHRALADCRMNQQVFECLHEEMEHPTTEVKICPRCGGFLKKRNGKFGAFWGCEGYPECRYTENA